MANEHELANVSHQTDILASVATEAFVTTDNILPLVNSQAFPDTTNVILFPHLGKVEAGAQAESAAYSYGADDEITDSETTVTGAKKSQAQKITVEAMRFGGPFATMERYTRASAQAMLRLLASDFKALFSSVSTQVTATSTLTKDNILDGRYNVVSSVKNAGLGPLVGMFDYKGMNEIAKELTDTTATAFTNQVELGVLGVARGGQPKGQLFDVTLFETDGLPTSGGDDIGMIWDVDNAFVAGIDGINGFNMTITEPQAATPWWELFMWTFWHIAEHNDTAACGVLSDT
jgi:hypothetical protein